MRQKIVLLLAGTVLACAGAGFAQQQAVPAVHQHDYSVAREKALQGTVVEFSATSSTAPIGAHVTLQTADGIIDVHLGNAHLLTANHFSLEAGDTVTVTGENVPFGGSTVFAARVIQKGAVSLTLRSKNGMPLIVTPRATNSLRNAGGAQ